MSITPPSSAIPSVSILEPTNSSQSNPTSVYEPMPANRVIVCRVRATNNLGDPASQVVGLAYGPGQTPPASPMGEPVVTFTRVTGSTTDWICPQLRFKSGGTQQVCAAATPFPASQVKVWAMFAGSTTPAPAVETFYGKCLSGPPPAPSGASPSTSPATMPSIGKTSV